MEPAALAAPQVGTLVHTRRRRSRTAPAVVHKARVDLVAVLPRDGRVAGQARAVARRRRRHGAARRRRVSAVAVVSGARINRHALEVNRRGRLLVPGQTVAPALVWAREDTRGRETPAVVGLARVDGSARLISGRLVPGITSTRECGRPRERARAVVSADVRWAAVLRLAAVDGGAVLPGAVARLVPHAARARVCCRARVHAVGVCTADIRLVLAHIHGITSSSITTAVIKPWAAVALVCVWPRVAAELRVCVAPAVPRLLAGVDRPAVVPVASGRLVVCVALAVEGARRIVDAPGIGAAAVRVIIARVDGVAWGALEFKARAVVGGALAVVHAGARGDAP